MSARITVVHGDCLDVLRTMPDASVDAVVTDPPYGLAEHKPASVAAALTAWLAGDREHVPDGHGFMGRAWDGFVPPPAVWDECLRVLKPGGHLLCFAGTRTFDLMGISIRLAGFEMRDGIGNALMAWVHGQGFPKGKGQLKPAWEPIIVARTPLAEKSVAANVLAHGTGGINVDGCRVETADDLNGGAYGGVRRGEKQDCLAGGILHRGIGEYVQPAGRWPANVILSHSPDCAEECGDGCPVAELDAQSGTREGGHHPRRGGAVNEVYGRRAGYEGSDFRDQPGGASRFFPVFRHDETEVVRDANGCTPGCPVAELDAQSGTLASGGANRSRAGRDGAGIYGATERAEPTPYVTDSGGASRFFATFRYQAKAPRSERPKVDGISHPTVKPLALIRWLVRLVTPPGGAVLDPFAGSGTTGQAAHAEGFRAILVEREADYLPLIAARLGEIPHAIEVVAPPPDAVLTRITAARTSADLVAAITGTPAADWTPAHSAAVDARMADMGLGAVAS